jgi:DNA ligase-associated metallophosphoesterase
VDGTPAIIDVAGERLQMLPERALFWPARRMLLVADAHFGKAARFRLLGVPVPAGTTLDNLQVLDALIERHRVARIVFLGDLFHGRLPAGSPTLRRFGDWRARWPALALQLVPGNHDRHAGGLLAPLAIEVLDEPHRIGPFALRHDPQPDASGYTLAGHVHPVMKLHGSGNDRVRVPCFVFGPAVGILPAFGAFTGGYRVELAKSDRLFVIAGDRVLGLPSAGRGRR